VHNAVLHCRQRRPRQQWGRAATGLCVIVQQRVEQSRSQLSHPLHAEATCGRHKGGLEAAEEEEVLLGAQAAAALVNTLLQQGSSVA
jgi:hypothetical protein